MNSSNFTSEDNSSKILWGFFSPILLFIGVTGNSLVITISLFKRKESVTSTIIFRSVLALTDMVILCAVLPKYWAEYVVGVNIRNISNFGCQLSLYITYVSMQYSAWIIGTMTVQRCLLLYKPFTFKRIWTTRATVTILVSIFIFLSAIDFHYFFTNEIKNNSCDSKNDEIEHFEDFVFVFIDLAFLCLIPFAIMLLGNIYYMYVGKKQIILRRSLTEGQRNPSTYINQQTTKATRLVMKLTWLFLLTTLPICIEMIVDSVYKNEKSAEYALDLAKTICYLIQLTGISLNVCIYINSDAKFRQQVGTMFNCYRKREWAGSSGSNYGSSVCSVDSRDTNSTRINDLDASRRKASQGNNAATLTKISTHSTRDTNSTRMNDLDTSRRKASQGNNAVTLAKISTHSTHM